MVDVKNCIEKLQIRIAAGHLRGIPVVEKAVEELLADTPIDRQKTALHDVRVIVEDYCKTAPDGSPQRGFADMVIKYIDKKMRELVVRF